MSTNGNATLNQEPATQQATQAKAHEGITFAPRVDILESDKELTLFADLPGVRSEDVELRFENGQLILTGHVNPRLGDKKFLGREYGEGNFYRTFALHESIDATRIEASCKHGVLTVRLPKVAAVQPRQISVKAQ